MYDLRGGCCCGLYSVVVGRECFVKYNILLGMTQFMLQYRVHLARNIYMLQLNVRSYNRDWRIKSHLLHKAMRDSLRR